MKPHHLAICLATLGLGACATAETAGEAEPAAPAANVIEENASIPFVSLGGIQDWKAQDDGSLLIEGRTGRFYRATFFGSCPDVKFAHTIGFKSDAVGQLDRFSSVIVDGRECPFKTLDEVEPPLKPAPAEAAPATAAPTEAAPTEAAPTEAAPVEPAPK